MTIMSNIETPVNQPTYQKDDTLLKYHINFCYSQQDEYEKAKKLVKEFDTSISSIKDECKKHGITEFSFTDKEGYIKQMSFKVSTYKKIDAKKVPHVDEYMSEVEFWTRKPMLRKFKL
jgi:hypothetical protein